MYPNNNIQYFANIAPTCRQLTYAEADWSVNVSGYSYFVVVNEYTNKYTSVTYKVRPNQQSAEWVEERPSCTISGVTHPHYYEQIDQVAWTKADASQGSTNHGISGWPNDQLTMYDTLGAQMTSVSGLMNNGTIFTDSWIFTGNDGYYCS
jgi:hypothetical protein